MPAFDDYVSVTLRTPRLSLEPLLETHAAEVFELLQDPAHYTFIPQNPPVSRHVLQERYKRLETRRSPHGEQLWLNWMIRLATGEAAGLAQATVYPEGRAIMAYELFKPFRGHGFATEALQAALDHLRDKARIVRATAIVDTRNAKSIALLERLGFQRTRFIENADWFKGSKSDEFEYVLSLTP